MQFQMPPNQSWPGQVRGLRNGFIAGLIVGMIIGWFFHGLVGLAVRFGFVLALLIPLAIVVWFFFLRPGSRPSSRPEDEHGRVRVYTWGSDRAPDRNSSDRQGQYGPGSMDPPTRERRTQGEDDIIDLEFEELKRQVDDEERRS